MKFPLYVLISQIFLVGASLGQGTLDFSNVPPIPNAPIFHVDCTTPLEGANFKVQLYAAPANSPENSLAPVGGAVSFLTGEGAGFFFGGTAVVPGVPPGATATLQVRAWESTWNSYEEAFAGGGLHGRSDLLQIPLGGNVGSVQKLHGMNSFCLVPEPSTWALGLLGISLLFWNRLRRFG